MIKTEIDKSQTDSACRMCKTKDETTSHIVSECTKLAIVIYRAEQHTREQAQVALKTNLHNYLNTRLNINRTSNRG